MDCEFTDLDGILIDLIINGVKHRKVQERLQDQGQELTIAKATEIGHQFELSQSQKSNSACARQRYLRVTARQVIGQSLY